MAYVTKSSKKGSKPNFPAKSSPGVSVSPGKGGVNIGTPTKCPATRSAPNLRHAYKS
jgi:hypothetical protein